ncbi:MAG: hypothetical protein DRJ42_08820 [Deltaproteobacteria bacterium]|nr:MAG: hypothetical protein DRJ42_08820 [Deltaproteobacteria bacterium]
MSIPELENLLRVRKLSREAPAAAELAGLLRSARARLTDAENGALHLESRFDLVVFSVIVVSFVVSQLEYDAVAEDLIGLRFDPR